MEISQICTDLINFLKSGNISVRDFREKTEKIESFCRVLSKPEMKQEFIKSSYIADVIQAILNMSIVATKRSAFKSQNFEAVWRFFSFLAKNNIPLSKEEKDIQELIKIMTDIITINVPNADEDCWTFWLKVFTEILKIPTFYNLFREECDENDSNSISYMGIESLFALIKSLMKLKKIANKDWYSAQKSQALILFSVFLEYSPYPPSPDTINSIFDISDTLADSELSDTDFSNLLGILNELIALSPITFLINSSSPFNAPFNEKIIQRIFKEWHEYQKTSTLRKSSSAYLLLFLTTMDALKYEISQDNSEKWAKRIIDVWSKFKNRDKILESCKDIPYLRADIEFLKRSKDDSISETLLQYIIKPNNEINQDSNIIWLFTAIGKYAPHIIKQDDWLRLLRAISSFEIAKAIWRNQQSLPDFYDLISVMVDVIESKSEWNNVFTFLINKQPSTNAISSFYSLISKILSKQKIDTKVAHQNHHLLWKEDLSLRQSSQERSKLGSKNSLWKDRSTPDNYPLEKLRCIHILIYYYGFANNDSRMDCFNTLISILDIDQPLPNDYLKQLALTICSIISSHPFPLIPVAKEETKEETIDDICNKLKKQLEITTAKKKIESPLQTENLFLITPESSQITVDDGADMFDLGADLLSEPAQDEEAQNDQNDDDNVDDNEKYALCNFISKDMQQRFIKNINTRVIKNESNECFFRLFLTSNMPLSFSPTDFYDTFKQAFNEKGNVESFPDYFKILLTITEEISDEDFQPFFEDIEEFFFDLAKQYIEHCDGQIQEFLKENSSMSWNLLFNISEENYFDDLPLLANFAVKCSRLALGTNDHFYNLFEDFLSTTVWIPILHLNICSYLLNLSLSEQQNTDIINSLENVTTRVLQVLLVPVSDRDIFINVLLNALKYDNSKPMEELFKSISNYSITPSMKQNLLNIMQYNYKNSNQIFDCFWELNSPFFIKDDCPTIRLQSIDTIISILKLKEISVFDGEKLATIKFEKDKYFKEFISPFIEEMLEEEEWDKYKQTIFTAIKTLIQIAAEIPELTTKSLNLIINSFSLHDYTIFPIQCINVLFSGLSTRIHFSLFLRQFIPMLTPQIEKLTDRLSAYPFELFYLNESTSNEEAKRMFCDKAAPFVMAYAIANSKQDLIDFFSSTLKKQQKDIIRENIFYISSYLLIAINESSSEGNQSVLKESYEKFMSKNKFDSPLPLLSFVSMASEDAIKSSYQAILSEKKYSKSEFLDVRNFIFMLYTTIFKAHHELVQSYYLQQFSLYISILFEMEEHKGIFEVNQTLYSDILALSVNLLEFVPPSESLILLILISLNIPENFDIEMVGFVKNIEDICIHRNIFGSEIHSCLDNFFAKFPKLLDKILIFDFLSEKQLEGDRRTPLMEFKRIAETRRLNQESINFLLEKFIDDPEKIEPINSLPNDMKRTVLNEVYHFAVLNPQTLALHLYSEMFLNFIHIHPSPLIVESNTDAYILLFKNLIELARDKDPSINRSALTALHIILSNSMLPEVVTTDSLLTMQLAQYKDYARPRKKIKSPDDDSPWICQFVCKYIEQMNDDNICYAFASIAASSPEFSQQLFPIMFYECRETPLFDQIYNEFKHFSEDPKKYFEECRIFISAFNYLRSIIFKECNSKRPSWHLKWFKKQLNFQKIMEVCLKIGDPYSAYQYAEFAREDINMSDEPLNRIFTHLGVNDLKYGLNHNFSNPLSVADLHSQEGRLGKALVLYDNGNNVKMMSDTLCDLHLYNLLGNMKISLSDKAIESLWRLRKWDLSSEIMRDINFKSHSASLFAVMQAFATNNEEAVNHKLSDFAKQFHFDLSSSVFTQLSYLLDASALQWFHAVAYKDSSKLQKLFPKKIIDIYRRSLDKLNQLSHQFYKITESANALHGVFFCILNTLNNASISLPAIPPKFFSEVISNSLENNEIESAQYFITLLHENQKRIPQFANFEQIRVLHSDNPHHAVSLLEKNYDQILLKENQLESEKRRNVFNLRVEFARASWCAHTNYLPSDLIYDQLNTVIKKCKATSTVDLMADAEFTLARVYHRQHREICDFFMSTEYKTITNIIQYEEACLKQKAKQPSHSATMRTAKQDLINYNSIIQHYKELFSTTIVKAIKNYMKALTHTNKYDLECSFSIIGIWFDYSYTKYKQFVQEVPDLISTMEKYFPDIDANKFLPLFYQLAARVDDKGEITSTQNVDYNEEFQNFLQNMVKSICQKSPNECFPVLFALERNNNQNKKVEAIQELIVSIAGISTELHQRWDQMKSLLKGYLRLTNAPQMKSKVNSLSKLDKGLTECTSYKSPFVTIITNSDEVEIDHFEDKVIVLNGVNHPLLLQIVSKDGRVFKQIVKGNRDDLRQDAVMQQLFVLSSKLLSRKNPNLSIRHYKVVPLSPKSGVIEFVEGSISIQDYLFKKEDKQTESGAHTRYYVNGESISMVQALTEFHERSNSYHKNLSKTEADRKKLITFFKELRSQMKPVFHFFFIEKFPNTGDWFVSRLRYSRHTATNSMVGHILGIGDRHLNNIMIDKKTGEIIHIDLGIAFDQGKALPVMEIVPFRLTSEIIDGMGWMGKEGIFRKTCQESMSVLRNNSEYLLTVLEVFMSDPLYTWNLVPRNQRERSSELILHPASIQSSSREKNKNRFAESAIVTCQRKLEGRETGENLSVEGQVSKLINDATSDENLAMMYAGWKPYL